MGAGSPSPIHTNTMPLIVGVYLSLGEVRLAGLS